MSTKTAPPADGKPAKGHRAEVKPLPQLELFAAPLEDPPPPPVAKPKEEPYQFRTRFFDID